MRLLATETVREKSQEAVLLEKAGQSHISVITKV